MAEATAHINAECGPCRDNVRSYGEQGHLLITHSDEGAI